MRRRPALGARHNRGPVPGTKKVSRGSLGKREGGD
jgi:hypothetical protein